jgi:hypothetical protein
MRNAIKIVDVTTQTALAESVKVMSDTPGAQRDVFLKEVVEHDYALALRYGKAIAVVDSKGELYSPDEDETDEESSFVNKKLILPGLHPDNRSYVTGSAPANKEIDGHTFPTGTYFIIAGPGVGKTPLAHALASYGRDKYGVVRLGEPLAGYANTEVEAAEAIASGMVLSSDLVVDSIKDLMSSGNNLMKSGISREVLTTVSSWSALACETGTAIYLPINPSTDDQEVVEMITNAAQSNATVAITHLESGKGYTKWKFFLLDKVRDYLERKE